MAAGRRGQGSRYDKKVQEGARSPVVRDTPVSRKEFRDLCEQTSRLADAVTGAVEEVRLFRSGFRQPEVPAPLKDEDAKLVTRVPEPVRLERVIIPAELQKSAIDMAHNIFSERHATQVKSLKLMQKGNTRSPGWLGARPRVLMAIARRTWISRALILSGTALNARIDGTSTRTLAGYARLFREDVSAHPLVAEEWYLAQNADVKRLKIQAAWHYIVAGDKEGRSPHPLFDVKRYKQLHASALRSWPYTALEHFLVSGAAQGLKPHPLFDPAFYAGQSNDAADSGINPLIHYLSKGWRQGLDPHPLFDTDYYLEQNPDVLRAEIPPLLHYVLSGWREGRKPHALFDPAAYLRENPDVRAMGLDPLVHYVETGWNEKRNPGPDFDTTFYLDANPDVAAAGINPLVHYLTHGAWENRTVSRGFNPGMYLASVPGAIQNRDAALVQWIKTGKPDYMHAIAGTAANAAAKLPARNQTSGQDVDDAGNLFQQLYHSARVSDAESYNWPAYVGMSAEIRRIKRERIDTFAPTAGNLVDIQPSQFRKVATGLSFPEVEAPQVTILIPVYNQIKYTLECLASLSACTALNRVQVIVADDASTDETGILLPLVKGLQHVRQSENLGFLRNVNTAAEKAKGAHIVILNNDVQVTPGWLDALLAPLGDETVGVTAPKLLFPNGRLQEAGARLNEDASAQLIGLFEDPKLPRYNVSRDVDYVSGACIAMRRETWSMLGGFDDAYAPAYCEDSDLCMRVWKAGLSVRYVAEAEVYHHLSVSSNAMSNDFKLRQVRHNQQKLIERWNAELEAANKVRVIALYLPQYHPIAENDRWWGAGFTEWANVTRALPNYAGHYQPHRPGELGYYDLRNPEIMDRQASLARSYGIEGFCYYYYSFSGRRVLEMPLDRLIETGKPDMPFCVCWANENWTRTWDGQNKDVLLEQKYRPEDDITIIDDISRFLRMPNYIRVNGRPLVIIYRPSLLPNPKRTVQTWRERCKKAGLGDIYVAFVENFEHALTYPSPSLYGCDATIEFPPSGMSVPVSSPVQAFNPNYSGVANDYLEVVKRYIQEPVPGHVRFRGVMPSWDNTARRQDVSYSYQNASPGAFQAWLEDVLRQTREQNHGDEQIVFVNAWNEWAEGAHLEPDVKFGRGWLEAVKNALDSDTLLSTSR